MGRVDGWSEWCLIGIAAQGGTNIAFQGVIADVDIELGEKPFESIAMLSGARVVKFMPETDTTVTFTAYPIQAGSGDISAATTGVGFYDLLHSEDIAQPTSIPVTLARDKYRVCILWTDKTTETDATAAIVAPTNNGIRFVAADGHFISAKPSFTDGILKWVVKFKVPPRDSAGAANIMIESVYSTSTTYTMTALQSYTSTVKW